MVDNVKPHLLIFGENTMLRKYFVHLVFVFAMLLNSHEAFGGILSDVPTICGHENGAVPGGAGQSSTGASFPECGKIFHLGDFTQPGNNAIGYVPETDETINEVDELMLEDYISNKIDRSQVACWQKVLMDINGDRSEPNHEDLDELNWHIRNNPKDGEGNAYPITNRRLRGDANNDGHVFVHPMEAEGHEHIVTFENGERVERTVYNLYDATDSDLYVIQRFLLGMISLTPEGLQQADFNGDDFINSQDIEEMAECFEATDVPFVPPTVNIPIPEERESQPFGKGDVPPAGHN